MVAQEAYSAHYTLCIPVDARRLPSESRLPEECYYRNQITELRNALTEPLVALRINALDTHDTPFDSDRFNRLRATTYRGWLSRITLRGVDRHGDDSYDFPVDIIVRNSDLRIIGFINGERGNRVFYRLQEAPERNAARRPTWNNAQYDYTRQRTHPRVDRSAEGYAAARGASSIFLPFSADVDDLAYWSGYSYQEGRDIEYRPGDQQRPEMNRYDGQDYYYSLVISRQNIADAFQELSDFEFFVDQYRPTSRAIAAEQRAQYRERLEDIAWALQQISLVYLEGMRFQFVEDAIAGDSVHAGHSADNLSEFDRGHEWSPTAFWPLVPYMQHWGEMSFMGSQGLSSLLLHESPASLRLEEGRGDHRVHNITSAPYDVGGQRSWARSVTVVQRAQWERGIQPNVAESCPGPSTSGMNRTPVLRTELRKRRSLTSGTDHPNSLPVGGTSKQKGGGSPIQEESQEDFAKDCQSVSWQVTSPVTLFGGAYLSREQVTRLVAGFMADPNVTKKYFASEWWAPLSLVFQDQEGD